MRPLNLFLLFFFLFALNSYSLPKCEGDDFKKWDNCKGTWTNPDGEQFAGEWKDGKQHGKGTHTQADGSQYVGEYKDGKKHGKGTFTEIRYGVKYEGKWKNGRRHGKGIFTFPDGTVYEGRFKNGEFVELVE